jgi:uncharacterized protein
MPDRLRSFFCLALLGAAVLSLAGCGSVATRVGFYEPIVASAHAGQYDSAAVYLETAKVGGKYGEKDRVVYYVDAGLAYHYARQFDSSNARLSEAETAAEELFTKSISKAALSLVLNDNALDYAGEDYEVLYTNLIKALNYLDEDNFEDAFVEIRRANLKLELLDQKYADAAQEFQRAEEKDSNAVKITYEAKPVRFHNSALARYLSMHMYAASGKATDADLDRDFLTQAFETQPFIYSFAQPSVAYHTDSGGVLSVVALAGMAPVKQAMNLRIRTDKDLNLVQVLYTDPNTGESEYGHFPIPVSEDYYFDFSIPNLIDRPSQIARIEVSADGKPVGELALLEDVSSVARETFEAKKSLIYIRSVARAVAKGLIAHRQKERVDTGGLGGWLKKAAIDAITDVSENADLRCARLLPGRVYVGDFVLQPGKHNLTVEFLDATGVHIGGQSYPDYEVTPGNFNLIEAVSLR